MPPPPSCLSPTRCPPVPPSTSQRQRRGQKEVASLGGMDGIAAPGGRPSRRAASAAQAAIAQAAVFEQPGGADATSLPRVAEQAMAMRLMEGTVEHAESAPTAMDVQLEAQPDGQADGAAAAPPADGAAPSGAHPTPAEVAAAAFAEAAGSANATRKRRRPNEPQPAAATQPPAPAPAPAPAGGDAATAPPAAPPGHPDVAEFVEVARQCESQDALRERLLQRFPPTRGRSVHNQHYRELFAALCPDLIFHVRAGARAPLPPPAEGPSCCAPPSRGAHAALLAQAPATGTRFHCQPWLIAGPPPPSPPPCRTGSRPWLK